MALLSLDSIRIDGGTQSRVEMSNERIAIYAESMADGETLPEVIVFFDGASYWLADGFHRYWAAQKNEAKTIAADVREGTLEDAILFAVSANSEHDRAGLPRKNADKRKCVLMLLESGKYLHWSDYEIAKQCAVTQPFVLKVRHELASNNGYQMPTTRTVTRNGKTYEQDTSNIGKSRKPHQERAEEETPVPAQEPNTEAQPETNERREVGPTCRGMQFARLAVMRLEEIPEDDAERKEALEYVAEWIKGQTK